MRTTLAAQLAQLELGALTVQRPPADRSTDVPPDEAVEQTLAGVWSDLFQLFPDTALEDDAEEIAWAFVNLFHRAAAKRSAQIDRATDEIRCLIASNDGSEVHASELEEQVARAQAAEAAMIGLESLREIAAALYLNETGSSWRPAGGSRLNHSAKLTSAIVDGRAFLRARAERNRKALLPEGTPVVFAGAEGGSRSRRMLRRRRSPTTSGTRSIAFARMSPTWCWSMAVTARASTGLPPRGPSSASCRRSRSRSTGASATGPGSAATSRCCRSILATSSRSPAAAWSSGWSSRRRRSASPLSIGGVRSGPIPSMRRGW